MIILLLSLAATGGVAEPVDSGLSIDSVAEHVLARNRRLKRLYVDTYMTTTAEGVTRTDRYALAFAPERFFLDLMHFTDDGTPPWRDNERFQLRWNREMRTAFKPFLRTLLHEPEDGRGRTYWKSPYGQAIGWRPRASVFEGDHDPLFFDSLFAPEHRDRLVVRSKMETVESLFCVIVETRSKSDQLWFAPELGFAPVRRIVLRGEQQKVRQTVHCRRFKEVAAGVWLPWRVESVAVSTEDPKEVLRSFRIDVQQLAANEAVSDALFEFEPPPGTITFSEKEEIIGFAPGGENLLDLWGAVCSEVFPPSSPTKAAVRQPLLFAGSLSGLGALVLAGMLLRPRISPARRPMRGRPATADLQIR